MPIFPNELYLLDEWEKRENNLQKQKTMNYSVNIVIATRLAEYISFYRYELKRHHKNGYADNTASVYA